MFGASPDPQAALAEVEAILFLMTTFGYVDGEFSDSERSFIEGWIEGNVVPAMRPTALEVFHTLDGQIADLFSESVAHGEEQATFVYTRLKTRCYEVFQGLEGAVQDNILDRLDELLMADGEAHPAELRLRADLADLLEAELGIELLDVDEDESDRVVVRPPAPGTTGAPPASPDLFGPVEEHYSLDAATLDRQVRRDLDLMDRAGSRWALMRASGADRLAGARNVADLVGQKPFLDGHVHVFPPGDGREYELTVLGDLHGCYSCLKAAVVQSNFLSRVEAYRVDPEGAPFPLLVLLGDYLDRGIYSFHGVLRGALELFDRHPEHVIILRGNHEYFLDMGDRVLGGVRPAEAIATMGHHLPPEVFRRYHTFFEDMPTWCLFDRAVFVHAGIPRDETLGGWTDLSSLNDPDVRFEAMWSDPSDVDFIPRQLQAMSNRFHFGRLQAQAFLGRVGAQVLVRGHEKIQEGFRKVYDDPGVLLCTLFSSGGVSNRDLPERSSYRKVTPMALTLLRHADGSTEMCPWRIDFAPYNTPEFNGFYRSEAAIPHVLQ